MIRTVVCNIGNHDTCPSVTRCQCPCHSDANRKAERQKVAREAAHASVMNFDHNPNKDNTQAAILALQRYYSELI